MSSSAEAQAASGPQAAGQIRPRPRALAAIAAGSTPATGLIVAVERQFADHRVGVERVGGDRADRRHHAERDRQVVVAALLRQIGGREIDGDALGRQRQPRGGERRAHPLARFADRLVGEADDVEGDEAARRYAPARRSGRVSTPSNAIVATRVTMSRLRRRAEHLQNVSALASPSALLISRLAAASTAATLCAPSWSCESNSDCAAMRGAQLGIVAQARASAAASAGDVAAREDQRVLARPRDRGRPDGAGLVGEDQRQADDRRLDRDHAVGLALGGMREHVGGGVKRRQRVDIDEAEEARVDASRGRLALADGRAPRRRRRSAATAPSPAQAAIEIADALARRKLGRRQHDEIAVAESPSSRARLGAQRARARAARAQNASSIIVGVRNMRARGKPSAARCASLRSPIVSAAS